MEDSGTLKVLSYNIHKGFNFRSRFTLQAIRRAIREVHPDLILLQEVLGDHAVHRRNIEKWPDKSQFEFLADTIWPHFAYGRNAVYTSGHHGNAILSKFPIQTYENIDISTNRFEKRGLLHAVIAVPGKAKPLHAICVHLGLFEAERAKQVVRICSRIASHVPQGEALLIGGDFNDWLKKVTPALSSELGAQEVFLKLTGAHARTFPSWKPLFALDRIYARGVETLSARCLEGPTWSRLSDHLPLYAEFRL